MAIMPKGLFDPHPTIQAILDQEKRSFMPAKRIEDSTMQESLTRQLNKAKKEKHIPAIAYYTWLLSQDLCAAAGYEDFKGSAAFSSWTQKKETVELFEALQKSIK